MQGIVNYQSPLERTIVIRCYSSPYNWIETTQVCDYDKALGRCRPMD